MSQIKTYETSSNIKIFSVEDEIYVIEFLSSEIRDRLFDKSVASELVTTRSRYRNVFKNIVKDLNLLLETPYKAKKGWFFVPASYALFPHRKLPISVLEAEKVIKDIEGALEVL